ncbi:MAG TPA: serine hydrolase domain-containing protein [Acidimicrobiales bacterium]|nr:serine hydrolase domain-containing protein [Acidimicrobiales bacterium]
MKVDPDDAGFDQVRLERITEHFQSRYVSTGKIPGCQVAVARRGKVAYWRSLGLMDRERSKPVEEDTIWRIYSMTKPVTSLALMQLYEQGLFQLADPLHRYIPEWRGLEVGELHSDGSIRMVDQTRPVSVRDALTHMTGLAGSLVPGHPTDDRFTAALRDARKGMTVEGVCSLLADFPLKFQPGSRWNYGLSTDVCARLVEILSGERFDRYLEAQVFAPLGMVDTGFSVPDAAAPRFAACYNYRPGGSPTLQDDPETSPYRRLRSYQSGAGGLVSTSGDYLRFCQMLLNGGELDGRRLLGRKTLDLMTANHLPGDGDLGDLATGGFGEAEFEGAGFGLGFAVSKGPAATATAGSPGEYYWGGAASTAFWVDPVEDLTVVFMTQLLPSSSYPFRAQLRALVYQALAD